MVLSETVDSGCRFIAELTDVDSKVIDLHLEIEQWPGKYLQHSTYCTLINDDILTIPRTSGIFSSRMCILVVD